MTKRSIPPPERRIHGSSPGPALFMRNPKPVSWSTWSLMPHCELWQAVCLSLDFEPPKRLDLVECLRVPHTTFIDRMKVCIANLGNKLPADNLHAPLNDRAAAQVDLETFAAVAESWAWDIPQALQARAQLKVEPLVDLVATPAKQRGTAQDETILTKIRELGHDPLRLQKNSPGKSGVKSQVRTALVGKNQLFPKEGGQLDKAWERLRKNQEIVNKD